MRMTRCCAYAKCGVVLAYKNPNKFQELNNQIYCSLKCLQDQYQGLGFQGAIHQVHQKFGPDHPVTRQIQFMRQELAWYRKREDLDDRGYIAKIKEALNDFRAIKETERN